MTTAVNTNKIQLCIIYGKTELHFFANINIFLIIMLWLLKVCLNLLFKNFFLLKFFCYCLYSVEAQF